MAVVATWHTEGRRQPSVIGKDPSGKPIPGGPYTGPQAAVAGAGGALAWLTHSLWGSLFGLNGIAQAAVVLGVAWYCLKGGAKIDYTHVGRAWDAVCGIRTMLTGATQEHPTLLGASQQTLDIEPSTFGTATQTITTVMDEPDATTTATGDQADAEPAVEPPHTDDDHTCLADLIADQVTAAPQLPRNRRAPKTARVTSELDLAPAEPHSDVEQDNPIPPADPTPLARPATALDMFLAAAAGTIPTGAHR